MKHELELELQAYLDGELSPKDARRVVDWIETDRDAKLLLTELQMTRDTLAGNEPPITVPESRDFYWSKIQREILREAQTVSAREERPFWLRWPKFVAPFAGAAAAAMLLMFSINQFNTPSVPMSDHIEVSSLVDAITFHDHTSGMTIVWLEPRNRGFTDSN